MEVNRGESLIKSKLAGETSLKVLIIILSWHILVCRMSESCSSEYSTHTVEAKLCNKITLHTDGFKLHFEF